MWKALFYDKNNNKNHGFTDMVTKKISLDDLNNEEYTYYSEEDAIERFNSNLDQKSFKIPNDLDKTLYKVKLYEKDKIKITTVSVNEDRLKYLLDNKQDIPSLSFLKTLCKFHIQYDDYSKEMGYLYNLNSLINEQNFKKNISETIQKVMEGVKYNAEEAIDDPVDADDGYRLLTTDLYDYQKCSIAWMVDKERSIDTIRYNLNKEIILGDYYYDMSFDDFFLTDNRPSLKFYGGGLIDEVGLGKTLQSATLSLLNQPKNISHIVEGLNRFNSKATLVMCPNTLCGQWKRELADKINKKYDLQVVSLLTKRDFEKYTYEDLCDADFVIVSFNYINNKNICYEWTKGISVKKNYLESMYFSSEIAGKYIDQQCTELTSDPIYNIGKTAAQIQYIKWHRIIVDEFHEIHSNNSYKAVEHILPFIQADYRWVVSGTPFISDMSLMHIVDFLTAYKSNQNRAILTDYDIIDYLSKKCFRRNTKKSVEQEYTLPPIEEEVLLLKFTKTERMMYNAYLADGNNDRFSKYLRQLCCHPNLAEETRLALANCKTLKDVEKMMVSHYKTIATNSKIKLLKIVKRIGKHVENINRFITKQQAKRVVDEMKKQGYKLEQKDDDEFEDYDKDSFENDDPDIDASDIDLEDGKENEPVPAHKDQYDYTGASDIILENYNISKKSAKLTKGKESRFIDEYIIAGMKKKELEFTTLDNLKNSYNEAVKQHNNALKELEGKMTSYRFFSNVVVKIKKTMNDNDKEEEKDDEDEETCGICMCDIDDENIGVSRCGHIFCYDCLKMWIEKKGNCPQCRKALKKEDMYLISYEKKTADKNENREKELSKQELIDQVGTKLANLIEYIKKNDKHTIIFSQWDDLLRKVGDVLNAHGVKNVFCRGSVFQRDKAVREFNSDDKIKVIMLSSESAASGTNLTKASQIILLDPVYGSYAHRRDTENQAIGRSHRLGQKNILKVVRLIIKDSVEEEIYNINKEEDKKHINQRKVKEISIDD